MKKILEKENYETPVVMEISPVSFVAGQGESGGAQTGSETGSTDDPDEIP